MQRVKGINRPINELIVHYTATPLGKDYSVDTIREWHRRDKGFSDIGYHYLIHPDGRVDVGRDIAQVGAHCTRHNFDTIGIAYIGGLDEERNGADTRTEAQKVALRAVLTTLKSVWPDSKVAGHNNYVATGCPGFDARKEYADISAMYDEVKEIR